MKRRVHHLRHGHGPHAMLFHGDLGCPEDGSCRVEVECEDGECACTVNGEPMDCPAHLTR